MGVSDPARLVVTLGYGLATSAFPYAGALYSHQMTAALLFASFALLWKAHTPGVWRLLSVGLLLGTSLISEYPTALIVGGLGLYALAMTRRLTPWLLIGAGMVPPLAIMAIHDLLIFGTPLPVGYAHSALWQTEHSTGFLSLSVPTWDAFWGVTFSPFRGLFYMSPFLLLGVVGLLLMARRPGLRPEALLCGWAVASFLTFNSASVMWFGGYAVGPRYLVPMLPFLALPAGLAVMQWGRSVTGRLLVAVLLIWSFAVSWSLTIGSQAFPAFDPVPLVTFSLPALAAGDLARNLGTLVGLRGWWSVLPLALAAILLMPPVGRGSWISTTGNRPHSDAAIEGAPYPTPVRV
jgi:hypothetical protein